MRKTVVLFAMARVHRQCAHWPRTAEPVPSNWELSTARATGIVRYLVARGVSATILSAQGLGDSQPVASNNTAQGRAKNRRVEIVIMAAGS